MLQYGLFEVALIVVWILRFLLILFPLLLHFKCAMGLDVEIYINGPLSDEIQDLAGRLEVGVAVSEEMGCIILYLFLGG